MDKYKITLTWGTAYVFATSYVIANGRYIFYVNHSVKATYLESEVVSVTIDSQNSTESVR